MSKHKHHRCLNATCCDVEQRETNRYIPELLPIVMILDGSLYWEGCSNEMGDWQWEINNVLYHFLIHFDTQSKLYVLCKRKHCYHCDIVLGDRGLSKRTTSTSAFLGLESPRAYGPRRFETKKHLGVGGSLLHIYIKGAGRTLRSKTFIIPRQFVRSTSRSDSTM